jgi:lipopolysaccharide export LptBFGC system permease protein LptF
MLIIDRYILFRFLTNFVLLFLLLFLFAMVIDVVVSLDEFVTAARRIMGDDAGGVAITLGFLRVAFDFQAPRLFQFFAYLHGLVAVGAMGFTLAQMHRHRELVAMLSVGISLQRVAMPFVVGVFGISVVQLLNQELLLPRVAPLLIRDHEHIGQRSVNEFEIDLTPDGFGNLVQAPEFDPRTRTLTGVTILERDERGRTARRITAESGVWTPARAAADGAGGAVGPMAQGGLVEGWVLTGGRAVSARGFTDDGEKRVAATEPVAFYATDLSPEVILVKRYGQFAAMLSLRQIGQMLATPNVADRDTLLRHRSGRFATVLVNVLVMWLALPTFLVRQPANLLVRTVVCAGICVPGLLGTAVFMLADLPGIAPTVGVFLPVVLLGPVVLAVWAYVKT